ncbi:response regulator [uncultured Roseovarius sp.]|uniref:response regulator transcription factor n=1 Tax=uncultured Roseovarius sp. TaxID=293344 RepID=UPI0026157BA5|nr:response regulator [uncultured Roseovarius sp.]
MANRPEPEPEFYVYVVEDDAPVLRSFCALLSAHGYASVPCESAEDFLAKFDPERLGCLLLDVRLPGMSGMKLQAQLTEMGIDIPIIIVTAHGDVPIAVQAMRAGAIDFIEKPTEADRLLEAIELAGGLLANRAPPELPKKIVSSRLAKLTEREQEVLRHMLLGKLNKEIAAELGISRRTIEVHRSRIREKMQVRGIADLIRMLG